MATYQIPFTGEQSAEYLAKARDFAGSPLGNGLYANNLEYTAYNLYLADNGAKYTVLPTVPLPYLTNTALYPQASSDPNLIVYTDFKLDQLVAIARSLNVSTSNVIYSTDTVTPLDNILYIYDGVAEIIYAKPVGVVTIGERIVSTIGNQLTTSKPAVYMMFKVSHKDETTDQYLGYSIYPPSSNSTVLDGNDITGYSIIRLTGGDFSKVALFTVLKKDGSDSSATGVISDINLTSRPYSATVGSDAVWLLDTTKLRSSGIRDVLEFWPYNNENIDSHAQIQDFLDYLDISSAKSAVLSGNFRISQGLNVSSAGFNLANVDSELRLAYIGSGYIQTMLTLDNLANCYFKGEVSLIGGGGSAWVNRPTGTGLLLRNSTRTKFDKLRVEGVQEWGVRFDSQLDVNENNSLSSFGDVKTTFCGTRRLVTATDAPIDWTVNIVDREVIVLADLPAGLERRSTIVIDGGYHLIKSIDEGTKTITLKGELAASSGASGTGAALIGGGVLVYGNDSNVVGFDSVDATWCSTGFHAASIFGSNVARLTLQSIAIGVVVGEAVGSSYLTNTFSNVYFEGADVHIMLANSDKRQQIEFRSTYNLNLDRVIGSGALLADSSYPTTTPTPYGISIRTAIGLYEWKQVTGIGVSSQYFFSQELNTHKGFYLVGANSNKTWRLEANERINKIFNHGAIEWSVSNSGGAFFDTGTDRHKIEPLAAQGLEGWTVNNQATYIPSFSANVLTVSFTVMVDYENKNWVVSYIEHSS